MYCLSDFWVGEHGCRASCRSIDQLYSGYQIYASSQDCFDHHQQPFAAGYKTCTLLLGRKEAKDWCIWKLISRQVKKQQAPIT